MKYALTGCRIFTGDEILNGFSVIVDHAKVEQVIPNSELGSLQLPTVQLTNGILAPGFIDTQVNGGGGTLFNDHPTPEGIDQIGKAHRRFGTTSFLPTLISDQRPVMEAAIQAVNQALAQKVDGVLGIHLEGPYLNTLRKGVHPESNLRSPEADAIELLSSLGDGVTLVTVAPEQLPEGFISTLAKRGVKVSIGHSAATYEEAMVACQQGVTGFTHLFNAMTQLVGREPGCVGAALDHDSSWCGLIVDTHHVHPASLRAAIRAKKPGKMMLVTDAIHTVGSDLTSFTLLGADIIRENGKVMTRDGKSEGTLAGSDLSMIDAVRNTVQVLGLSLEESLRMASLYPAGFLGLSDELGRIATGFYADFTLFNDDFEVLKTWIRGRVSN